MKTAIILLLVLLAAGVVSGRQGRGFDFAAIHDSLRDVPPKQRAWWLQARGLDASYYTSYRLPDTGDGLRLVGKWGRGPSREVTGQGSLVALALGSEAALLDFSNPAHPVVLAEVQLDYKTRQVALRGSLLITGGNGIQLWDIGDPSRPVQLGEIPYAVADFIVRDSLVYFVSRDTFFAYSIADPSGPRRVGHCPDSGYVTAASPGLAVLVRPDDRLGFIDIADPTLPRPVGTYPGWVLSADIRGNLCCAAFADPGNQDRSWFLTLDVSDPANPRQMARLDNVCGYDMYLDSSYAILSGRYEAYESFQVVSIADSMSPRLVGELDLPGQKWGIWSDLEQSRALVASSGFGLAVVDLSNVTAPRLDTVVMRADEALDVWVDGARAYVANWRGGLQMIDVQDPSRPTQLGLWDSVGATSQTVAAKDSFAFIDWRPGPQFRSVLVSDPTNPREVTTLTVPSRPADMVLHDTLLYAAGRMRFYVVNVARPREPVLVGSCQTQDGTYFGLAVQDSFAYLMSGWLQIINIARPDAPSLISSNSVGGAFGVAVRDTFVYVPYGYDTLRVFSAADPRALRLLGYAPLQTHAWDVALAESSAAVATFNGLELFSLTNPSQPQWIGAASTPYGPRRVVYSAPYYYAAMWDAGVAIYEPTSVGMLEGDAMPPWSGRLLTGLQPTVTRGIVRLMLSDTVSGVLTVSDAVGRQRISFPVRPSQGQSIPLDLTELKGGVYFVQLLSEGIRETVKLVKE